MARFDTNEIFPVFFFSERDENEFTIDVNWSDAKITVFQEVSKQFWELQNELRQTWLKRRRNDHA